MTIQVELHGANGSRTTEVNEPRGMLTRGFKAPREAVPSIFGDVSIKRQATPPVEPTPEPDSDIGEQLKALLAEVNGIMEAGTKPRVNTEQISRDAYHYTEPPKRKDTNWESPAVTAWNHYRHIKSDQEMAYRRQRAEVQDAS